MVGRAVQRCLGVIRDTVKNGVRADAKLKYGGRRLIELHERVPPSKSKATRCSRCEERWRHGANTREGCAEGCRAAYLIELLERVPQSEVEGEAVLAVRDAEARGEERVEGVVRHLGGGVNRVCMIEGV